MLDGSLRCGHCQLVHDDLALMSRLATLSGLTGLELHLMELEWHRLTIRSSLRELLVMGPAR